MYKENYNTINPYRNVHKTFLKHKKSPFMKFSENIKSNSQKNWNESFKSAKNQTLNAIGRRLAGDRRGFFAINSARAAARVFGDDLVGGRRKSKRRTTRKNVKIKKNVRNNTIKYKKSSRTRYRRRTKRKTKKKFSK